MAGGKTAMTEYCLMKTEQEEAVAEEVEVYSTWLLVQDYRSILDGSWILNSSVCALLLREKRKSTTPSGTSLSVLTNGIFAFFHTR